MQLRIETASLEHLPAKLHLDFPTYTFEGLPNLASKVFPSFQLLQRGTATKNTPVRVCF
jgi:hypothetical protein